MWLLVVRLSVLFSSILAGLVGMGSVELVLFLVVVITVMVARDLLLRCYYV